MRFNLFHKNVRNGRERTSERIKKLRKPVSLAIFFGFCALVKKSRIEKLPMQHLRFFAHNRIEPFKKVYIRCFVVGMWRSVLQETRVNILIL